MTDKQEIKLPDPAYEIAMHESFDFPRPIPYLGYDRLPVGTKLYTGEAIRSLIERLEAAEKDAARSEWLAVRERFAAVSVDFGRDSVYQRHRVVWYEDSTERWRDAEGDSFEAAIDSAMGLSPAKSAGELQAADSSPQVPAPERLHPLHDPRPDAGLVSGGVPFGVPPTGLEHQGNDASPGHKFNGGGQAGGSGVSGGLEAGRSGDGGVAEGVNHGSSS